MIYTRANAEVELIDRYGGWLTAAGKDGTTVDGTNASLNGPLRSGLLGIDISPAAITVADVDLSTLTDSSYVEMLDFAGLRLLKNVLGGLTKVDQQVDRDDKKWSQLRDSVLAAIKALSDELKIKYGYATGKLTMGSINLGFQQSTDEVDQGDW